MKILDWFKSKTENRSIDFFDVYGVSQPAKSEAGLKVNPENALCLTAVWSAVDQISNSIAKLPISVYKHSKGGMVEDKNNPVYKLLNKPNEYMTRFDFFKTMTVNLLLYGNAYALIDKSGIETKLSILNSAHVTPYKDPYSDKITYQIGINGKAYTVDHSHILHFKRISLDGYTSLSPVIKAREILGIANSSNEYISSYYENGLMNRGIIQYVGDLDSKAEKALIKGIESYVRNDKGSKVGGVIPMPLGMQYLPMNSSKFVDMDFLNTVRFYAVEEVARLFNMPVTMLGDLSKATFSNVENLNLLYYKNCISPIVCSMENELDDKLFIVNDIFKTKFDMASELHGDTTARVNYYKELQIMGAITPNEVRVKEGFAPLDNPAMNETYMTLNNAPVDSIKDYQLSKNPTIEGQRKSNNESEVKIDGEGVEKPADTVTN